MKPIMNLNPNSAKRKILAALCVVAMPLLLSGCPAAVVGAAAAGGAAINDSRTIGALADDEAIENKILVRVYDEFGDSVHIGVTSYNRRVLLVGQAPSAETRQKILDIVNAMGLDNVRRYIDHIEIGNPSSLTSRASDSVLTARVKTDLCLLQREDFSCLNIKVVSEKGVVYLLGLVGEEEAAIAIETARRVPGVIRVVKVFEFR